jgi:orotidine-5'-phosphate decarboxylase
MKFQQKLDTIIHKNNSLVCVGLDSDITKIPLHLQSEKYPQFEFNKAIIDATQDLVCAYKPNSAFYESRGDVGILELKMTCDYINQKNGGVPIILDAKRADIGNTNTGYINFAFDYLGADAITLHPYLGKEALSPFLDRSEKGIIILCRTSNPGAGEFQDLLVNDKPLYQIVAQNVITNWNYNHNCLLVVGATYPDELKIVRKLVGDMMLLIPGIGAQGGDLEKTLKNGLNHKKSGIMINSSRGIIFASNKFDFAEKARQETIKLQNEINMFRR